MIKFLTNIKKEVFNGNKNVFLIKRNIFSKINSANESDNKKLNNALKPFETKLIFVTKNKQELFKYLHNMSYRRPSAELKNERRNIKSKSLCVKTKHNKKNKNPSIYLKKILSLIFILKRSNSKILLSKEVEKIKNFYKSTLEDYLQDLNLDNKENKLRNLYLSILLLSKYAYLNFSQKDKSFKLCELNFNIIFFAAYDRKKLETGSQISDEIQIPIMEKGDKVIKNKTPPKIKKGKSDLIYIYRIKKSGIIMELKMTVSPFKALYQALKYEPSLESRDSDIRSFIGVTFKRNYGVELAAIHYIDGQYHVYGLLSHPSFK